MDESTRQKLEQELIHAQQLLKENETEEVGVTKKKNQTVEVVEQRKNEIMVGVVDHTN